MSFREKVRLAFSRGDNDVVVRLSEAAIDRARATGNLADEVEAHYNLARVALRDDDLPRATALAREGLAVALRSDDRGLQERPRHVLAAVARMSGDLARSRTLYQELILLNEALEQPKLAHTNYHNLAFCEVGLGNLDVARTLFAACRERVFRHGWDDLVPYVYMAAAAVASAEGDHPKAARMIGTANEAFAALGQVPDPDDAADLDTVRDAAIRALGPAGFADQCSQGQLHHSDTAFDNGVR
ncbi:tetratricopeptide repeat protein [Catellatospora citrea]|uniref:Tetratricopeptide repeat protein n=1 Tax=Catellatospora citrea TaxID=53366 RepID=A0A8J3KQR5_9ACTN|nr:tetratricopeptide repeat protein [Catellatospora citrea]RKE10639.1 hypothetical protein C8E86_5555 [Catellatospora citrea]GIG03179.1 hypothetical protein Cci01nite_82720 [Catellatospora citrea]